MAQDWGAPLPDGRRQDLWLHPPRCLIAQAVRRLQVCGGRGTILAPFDRRAVYWPLICPGAPGTVCGSEGGQLREVLPRSDGLLWKAGEPLREGSMHLVAVRLDFSTSSTNAWEDAVRWRCGHAMRGVGVSVPAAV